MGCWPIAGVTSIDVTEEASLATLQAALDSGINFFDTAYVYGYVGESERLISRALGHRRGEIVIASKGGIAWGPDRKQVRDARPDTILRQCEESLKRLGTDVIDLYYLHAPDGVTPLAESATAFRKLLEQGRCVRWGSRISRRPPSMRSFRRSARFRPINRITTCCSARSKRKLFRGVALRESR